MKCECECGHQDFQHLHKVMGGCMTIALVVIDSKTGDKKPIVCKCEEFKGVKNDNQEKDS